MKKQIYFNRIAQAFLVFLLVGVWAACFQTGKVTADNKAGLSVMGFFTFVVVCLTIYIHTLTPKKA